MPLPLEQYIIAALLVLFVVSSVLLEIEEATKTNHTERNKNNYYVYTLTDAEGVFYVGITNDPNRRLKEHKATFGPDILMQSTGPMNLAQARIREIGLIAAYGTKDLYKLGKFLVGGNKIIGNQIYSISNRRYPTSIIIHACESEVLLWMEKLGSPR
ncbi:MAG: GIY-YIG nuclease family protein [Firmicutes bacterium]|nr:GIY-YIG nuclease family protein [Bacillota bacterium]